MSRSIQVVGIMLALCSVCATAGTQPSDTIVTELSTKSIDWVRINLNASGAELGFETVVAGDDPRITPLIHLIRNAEPGKGHKCSNVGAVRFRMKDGSLLGLGLLPSHNETDFELRLYGDDQFLGVLRVDRQDLLAILESLGVPQEHPWLKP